MICKVFSIVDILTSNIYLLPNPTIVRPHSIEIDLKKLRLKKIKKT